MIQRKSTTSGGFTIVELVITKAVMLIAVSAIGLVIVDSQRGWNLMYDCVNSNVVTDGYVARKKFDSIIRKACGETITLDENGSWIEVCYYASDSSTTPDRFACFYEADGYLHVAHGKLDYKVTLDVETICENVSICKFTRAGRSVQMILKLDNGTHKNTIVSSAVTHN
jgi:hypothetical protein